MSARREYWFSPVCNHEGCVERANFVCETRADQRAAYKRQAERPWLCSRHIEAGAVLSADNTVRETVLVSYETDFGYPGKTHRFFAPEGQETGGNGFQFGPGFKAFAEDFPAGTRLIVTARVEIPTPAPVPSKESER